MFDGVRYLGRGIGWVARRPAQWVFGLIPALITLVLFGWLLVWFGFQADDVAAWLTPFADGWAEGLRNAVRIIAAVALFAGGAFVALLMFTAVTLIIGEPFYEELSLRVERSFGGEVPESDEPFLKGLVRSVRDAIVLGVAALCFGVTFFALGFIPVLGQTVVPVVAIVVSGYFLAGELTGIAMDRRGLKRKERFAVLRSVRARTLGFGTATAVLFLIPLGAVVFMPGAVAGATLLARDVCDDDTSTGVKVA
ncbi:EI24 domain-containing protein [Actinocorallia sp. A-T 12471]|uniref:EI24 domain-containing protein n=1 Tax=Actinocorallia sp. A-T 12471 TaxID=3089813 RepID=UPI0029CCF102|nr:EI24 domain-containing protein [Actinocorallia sp. A-T 12471]MDX6742481.1 EI24 domain-containing protein [Actinocorallia sp. A-T 12471]